MFRELTAVIKIPTSKGSSRLRIVALNIRQLKNIGKVIVRVSIRQIIFKGSHSISPVLGMSLPGVWLICGAEHVPRFVPSIAKTLLAEPNLLCSTDKLL